MTTTLVAPPEAPASAGYAGLATRLLAFVADVLFIDVAAWLVAGLVVVAASVFGLSQDVQKVLIAGGAVIGALWAAGYFMFFWSTTGQTPGNRIMRIRVKRDDGDAPISVGHALARVAGLVVSALLLFIPFLLILVDDRRRGLHDRMGRSVVVYVPRLPRGH
jgi:uncharacterized RDD family membrane protein YckC